MNESLKIQTIEERLSPPDKSAISFALATLEHMDTTSQKSLLGTFRQIIKNSVEVSLDHRGTLATLVTDEKAFDDYARAVLVREGFLQSSTEITVSESPVAELNI